eukprot:scaffold156466_cov23-Tisochrysis_lutea.AAC.1
MRGVQCTRLGSACSAAVQSFQGWANTLSRHITIRDSLSTSPSTSSDVHVCGPFWRVVNMGNQTLEQRCADGAYDAKH